MSGGVCVSSIALDSPSEIITRSPGSVFPAGSSKFPADGLIRRQSGWLWKLQPVASQCCRFCPP